MRENDFVIAGKVVDITPGPDYRPQELRVTFKVSKQWKPAGQPHTKKLFFVHAASNGAICGYPFKLGKEYLVFAQAGDHPGDTPRTSLCNGTRTLAEAAVILPELDK